MVVMDRQDCINKAQVLLGDKDNYMLIFKDLTSKLKITIYKYSETANPKEKVANLPTKDFTIFVQSQPNCMDYQRSINKTFLRPIVSSMGSITYGVAMELASILRPLVGGSPHHINNTQHFVEQTKSILLEQGKCMPFYDVKVIVTSAPVDHTLDIIHSKLQQDPMFYTRNPLSVNSIITLLEFCLKVPSSCCKVSIMNRYRGLQWGLP